MRQVSYVIILMLPLAASAAAQDKQSKDKSSAVDTRGEKALAPGTHPASPGTVGALNSGNGGSLHVLEIIESDYFDG